MTASPAFSVICAMESEAVHLRRMLGAVQELPLARWRRSCGTLDGVNVEIVVSGIGMVNAAAATTALCVLESPRAVLSYGCSGAHHTGVYTGDVVLGSAVAHFTSYVLQADGVRRHTGFGNEPGGEGDPTAVKRTLTLPADPTLLALARAASVDLPLPRWPGRAEAPQVHEGVVASADVWTQHADSIRALHEEFGSLCEEMEAAAIAQVCARFGLPFLAVKDISNNELHALTDLTAPGGSVLVHVEDEVGRRAAHVVAALIRASASGSANGSATA